MFNVEIRDKPGWGIGYDRLLYASPNMIVHEENDNIYIRSKNNLDSSNIEVLDKLGLELVGELIWDGVYIHKVKEVREYEKC